MKLLLRILATLPVLALAAIAVETATSRVDASVPSASNAAIVPIPPRVSATGWFHPDWYPAGPDLDAVTAMEAVGPRAGPVVKSRSAFVYDLDSNEVLYEKNADVVRPVASLTKMVSALALVSTASDLDTEFCVGAAQYPTRSGARSRLSTGDCLSGWDALGAALVASDNRAAYGLAAVAGLDVDEFVARMNEVSVDLDMHSSTWTDPSGLEDENLSTARDVARATVAVALHPVLSAVATAPFWDVHRVNKGSVRRLWSTDRVLGRDDVDVLAAKTGYTDTARYCFSTVMQSSSGRRIVVTLLGGEGKMTRWADIDRVLRWVEAGEAVARG